MKSVDEEAKATIEGNLRIFQENKENIRQQRENNPAFAEQYLEREKAATLAGFAELEPMLDSLISLVKDMRPHVGSLTSRNRNAACYFLFGKVTKTLRACVTLAHGGFYHDFMELARSITENLDLIQLFVIENEHSENLKKWLDGIIVDNGTARKAIRDDITRHKENALSDVNISPELFEKMKIENHRKLSKFSHASYVALLDSYDVVNDDFDFADVAGFHFLKDTGVRQLKMMLEATYVYLRQYFLSVGDKERFKVATETLDSFSDISSPGRVSQAKKVAESMNEKYKAIPGENS